MKRCSQVRLKPANLRPIGILLTSRRHNQLTGWSDKAAAAIDDAEAERDALGWEEADEQELQMMGSCLQAMRRRDLALEFEDWDDCEFVIATARERLRDLEYRKVRVLEQDE